MRESIKRFVRIVAETLPILEPVFEFGSLQVSGQEGFADLRPFFPHKKYVGCDMRPGLGVDRVLNLHDIDLPPESVGTLLCMETMEHVEYPRKAIAEMHRILKPSGFAVLSSVLNFPIHEYPSDYWRFTPEGFRSLLKPFGHAFVAFAGHPQFPHTVLGVGFKSPLPETLMNEFGKRVEYWKEHESGV